MLAHVGVAAHAGIAKAVELFGVRERAFDRLLSPSIKFFPCRSFCKSVCLIQIVLPHMPRQLLSFVACSETLCSLWARLTCFFVAAVLTKTFAVCVVMLEQAAFRTDIAVERGVVAESIFAVGSMRVGVPTISKNRLNVITSELVRDRGIVVSSVESHIEWQVPKSFLNLLKNDGDCIGVVHVCRSDMRVDNDVVPTVYRKMLAVVK